MSEESHLLATTPLKFDQIFEGAPDPMVVVDEAGVVVAANSRVRDVLGYEPADLLGGSIEVLIPEEVRAAHVDKRRQYMAAPHVRPMGAGLDLLAQHRDGRRVPVEVCLSPCACEGRHYVISTLRDVSRLRRVQDELRRRTEELQASNRELEQFAYVASHDLQEPLRHIMGFCQILQDDHTDSLDEDGHHCLDVVTQATGRMRELINDLLEYSRAGQLSRPAEDVDVAEVMSVVESNLQQALLESGADLVVGSMPVLRVDNFHLIGVLQNLVANAVKFRKKEVAPRIEVQARREDDAGWHFTVQDNGIGIDEEYMEKIFVIFQKLHARQHYDGTGIGLSIVRKTVEHLGGRVWVESTPGEGSTFHFVIPDQVPGD